MEYTISDHGNGVAVISIAGRLNMVTAVRFREVVADAVAEGSTRVAVDLSSVTFLDSSGLGALISGLKTARQSGGDLRLVAPTEQVQLVLKLTNMDRVLAEYADIDAAFPRG